MKVLAFAASSSKQSINKKLVTYAANLIDNSVIEVLDLNDYEIPIFSETIEQELGKPKKAQEFFNKIGEADVVLVSYAEHNGSYTAAFKNLFDWTSRINMKVYQNKPMIILSTSPGAGGASTVLNTAVSSAPHFAADVIGSLSVPSFYDNFDQEKEVLTNDELIKQLKGIIAKI